MIAIGSLFLLFTACSSIFTVPEGHVTVVRQFGEAKAQYDPGLRFKYPLIEDTREIEVRTRKNLEKMKSSTSEQMPVTVEISVNWTVNKDFAMELYKKYGGLEQFEARILDPRFRSATKQVIPKFKAEQLIRDRATAIGLIEAAFVGEMEGFPVVVDNVQIENITLPANYLQSIEQKQTAKNLADAEKHKLERQRLEALRGVNVADAKAQGIVKVAKAEAEAIKLKGNAQAEAILAKGKALKGNPLLVKLTEADNWDGKLPNTILGAGTLPILNVGNTELSR